MKIRLLSTVCVSTLLSMSFAADAELVGRLPSTPSGTNYQAYYDTELDITWTANANINGAGQWDDQVSWAASLDINGISGWRLSSIDEMEYLYSVEGITNTSSGPFSKVQEFPYFSGTEESANNAWRFSFFNGETIANPKNGLFNAWAVHSGDVSAVPVPAAVWLFGSSLVGLIGVSRRKG